MLSSRRSRPISLRMQLILKTFEILKNGALVAPCLVDQDSQLLNAFITDQLK